MKGLITIILLSFLTGRGTVEAQIRSESPSPAKRESSPTTNTDRGMFTGGNVWLQFGTNTYIELSPTIGYRYGERFRPGVGFSYIYQRINSPIYGIAKQSIYGARGFASYQLFENIALYAELERMSFVDYSFVGRRIWLDYAWVGGILRRWLSDRAALDLQFLYDLRYEQKRNGPNLYGSPFTIRMSFIYDL